MSRFVEVWTLFKYPQTSNDYFKMRRYFSLINLDNVTYQLETKSRADKYKHCISFYYDNDKIFEERYIDDELAFKRLNYLNEFNADKDFDGVIEFENKKYDTKDIVMIKHTGPYKIYAGKTKNFYRLKLQTKETFITIVNEGLIDGFNFINSIQRKYIR